MTKQSNEYVWNMPVTAEKFLGVRKKIDFPPNTVYVRRLTPEDLEAHPGIKGMSFIVLNQDSEPICCAESEPAAHIMATHAGWDVQLRH